VRAGSSLPVRTRSSRFSPRVKVGTLLSTVSWPPVAGSAWVSTI